MTQLVGCLSKTFTFINKAIDYLPKNSHGKKVTQLSKELQSLQEALNDKTSQVFQTRLTETRSLTQEKEECLKTLQRMNGFYYQDPNCSLKNAWDGIVETVQTALNVQVQTREQLKEVQEVLDRSPANEQISIAKTAILNYLRLENDRNECQARLDRILAAEMPSPELRAQLEEQKKSLESFHRTLCGEYFGDPNGTLRQYWTCYPELYAGAEAHRIEIEKNLEEINLQLSYPSSEKDPTVLTERFLNRKISELTLLQQKELKLAGVDWKGLASGALLAAGYIIIS